MVVDWFYWTRMGQLDIDPSAFPDPQAMNQQLHARGVHSIISVWPRFEKESRYFIFLAAKSWLLKDPDGRPVDGLAVRSDRAGALIDSTNSRACVWYWDRVRDNVISQGFDWLWLDETEPDLVSDGYFYSIGSGDRYHNVFPLFHRRDRRGLAPRPAEQAQPHPRAGRLPRGAARRGAGRGRGGRAGGGSAAAAG